VVTVRSANVLVSLFPCLILIVLPLLEFYGSMDASGEVIAVLVPMLNSQNPASLGVPWMLQERSLRSR
jgi:hypothetical protein